MSVEELVANALGTLSVVSFGQADSGEVIGAAGVKATAALAVAIADVAAALREPRAGLPVVPATPAGTTALGDLPELRDMKIYLESDGIRCHEPGCDGDLGLPWRRTTVRDLLAAMATHRRYHLEPPAAT